MTGGIAFIHRYAPISHFSIRILRRDLLVLLVNKEREKKKIHMPLRRHGHPVRVFSIFLFIHVWPGWAGLISFHHSLS